MSFRLLLIRCRLYLLYCNYYLQALSFYERLAFNLLPAWNAVRKTHLL